MRFNGFFIFLYYKTHENALQGNSEPNKSIFGSIPGNQYKPKKMMNSVYGLLKALFTAFYKMVVIYHISSKKRF
jgi:hypothetical protein